MDCPSVLGVPHELPGTVNVAESFPFVMPYGDLRQITVKRIHIIELRVDGKLS